MAEDNLQNSLHTGGEKTEAIDVVRHLRVFWRHGLLIFFCTTVFMALFATWVLSLTPRYDADAVLEITSRQPMLGDAQSSFNSQADAGGTRSEMEIVRSEVQLVVSFRNAQTVLNKLGLLDNAEFLRSVADRQHGRLVSFGSYLRRESAQLFNGSAPLDDAPATGSDGLSEQQAIFYLMEMVSSFNDGRSYIIKVHAETTSPELSAAVANAFAGAYLDQQQLAKRAAAQQASNWLTSYAIGLRSEVQAAENAVAAFREQHHLTETRGVTVQAQQLVELNTQLIAAASERARKEASFNEVQAMLRNGTSAASASEALASPLIQRLQEARANLLRQTAEMEKRLGPLHPAMINNRAQIAKLESSINEELANVVRNLSNEVKAAQTRESALRQRVTELQQVAADLDQAQVRLRELEREAEAKRALLSSMLKNLNETVALGPIQQADAQLVSQAEPPLDPAFPPLPRLLTGGALAAFLMACGLALLLDRLSRGFNSAEQLTTNTGIPTLGLVPYLKRRRRPHDTIMNDPTCVYSEAVHAVAAALQAFETGRAPKIILITSSLPGEGKTVFAASLARSMVKSGRSCLLIDSDFRRPSVGKALGQERAGCNGGLLLNGTVEDLSAQIAQDASGLHYLSNLGAEEHPHSIISSPRFRNFLREARNRYDAVLLDAPPVLGLSDAVVLASAADAIVFVVRWNETPRKVVHNALRMLQQSHCNFVGAVISQVDLKKHAKYGYGDIGYYSARYARHYSAKRA